MKPIRKDKRNRPYITDAASMGRGSSNGTLKEFREKLQKVIKGGGKTIKQDLTLRKLSIPGKWALAPVAAGKTPNIQHSTSNIEVERMEPLREFVKAVRGVLKLKS